MYIDIKLSLLTIYKRIFKKEVKTAERLARDRKVIKLFL